VLAIVVSLATVLSSVACSGSDASPHATGNTVPQTRPPVPAEAPVAPSVTTVPLPPAPTVDLSKLPRCWPDGSLSQPASPAPPDLAAALDAFRRDPSVAPNLSSVSIWIDGLGEVLASDPDRQLAPASNQKLLTAMGALSVLGPDARLTTELRLSPSGDLVIEPAGDATLTSLGPHSLAALAEQARASGVTGIAGSLLVDESRHDGARRAAGWEDWQIPAYTGPLSAFMVDDNRWRRDPAFLGDPAIANADRLRGELATLGIGVLGPTGYAPGPVDGRVIARLESPTIAELVATMLLQSDNQIADELLPEIAVAAGAHGSMSAGAAATSHAIAFLCVPVTGHTDDGSGLSHSNAQSARGLRELVQAARVAPWWSIVDRGLPVAGRTGTLAGRFHGTAADGNVRAKTGTIIGGAALTGFGVTAAGRAFVFSVIVNGPGAQGSAGAIDALVSAVAASPV
jgi:D-alanyl-D-alanine carboxypeptidase/D-alanyl-D-alanine-endopeptidase (penicillin-binding protein 4)